MSVLSNRNALFLKKGCYFNYQTKFFMFIFHIWGFNRFRVFIKMSIFIFIWLAKLALNFTLGFIPISFVIFIKTLKRKKKKIPSWNQIFKWSKGYGVVLPTFFFNHHGMSMIIYFYKISDNGIGGINVKYI